MIDIAVNRYLAGGREGYIIQGVVVHTTEGGENVDSIIGFLQRPGTTQGKSSVYGSSYDAVATPNGTYEVLNLGPNGSPYAAPPLNRNFLHIVVPGTVYQADDETGWRDPFSLGCIRAVARYIVQTSRQYGFEDAIGHRLTVDEMRRAGSRNVRGYCGHGDVSAAWPDGGSMGHTDPGPNFPWGLLDNYIKQEQGLSPLDPNHNAPIPTTPKKEEDIMWTVVVPVNEDGEDCYATFVGPMDANGILGEAIWSGPGNVQYVKDHIAAGAKTVRIPVAAFKNVTLLGPLPYGDERHDWQASDFHVVVGNALLA